MNANDSRSVIRIRDLGVSFQVKEGEFWALKGLSFQVFPREFVCVLGPSGSGKTTLLRTLAGLLPVSEGSIEFTNEKEPHRIGLVFQQANLLPWRNTLQNITLPLELAGVPQDKATASAQEWVEFIGLKGFEKSWPRDLSGGMAQRVALARALIQDPELLLLDEPFGSLDALTREHMGAELLNIWQLRRKTVIMVTHSIAEALLLADRILLLTSRPGRVLMDMSVDFPRPRSEEIRYSQKFGDLSRDIKKALDSK